MFSETRGSTHVDSSISDSLDWIIGSLWPLISFQSIIHPINLRDWMHINWKQVSRSAQLTQRLWESSHQTFPASHEPDNWLISCFAEVISVTTWKRIFYDFHCTLSAAFKLRWLKENCILSGRLRKLCRLFSFFSSLSISLSLFAVRALHGALLFRKETKCDVLRNTNVHINETILDGVSCCTSAHEWLFLHPSLPFVLWRSTSQDNVHKYEKHFYA